MRCSWVVVVGQRKTEPTVGGGIREGLNRPHLDEMAGPIGFESLELEEALVPNQPESNRIIPDQPELVDEGEHGDLQTSPPFGGKNPEQEKPTFSSQDHDRPSSSRSLHFQDGVRRIDYVLAVKTASDPDDEAQSRKKERREYFEKNLVEVEHLELEYDTSSDDVHFIKVHVPFDRLCKVAEQSLLRLPISEDTVVEHSLLDRVLESTCGTDLLVPDLEPEPNQHTAIFTRVNAKKFLRFDDRERFFTPSQRSLLCRDILSRAKYSAERDKIGIGRLLSDETYAAAYPLHTGSIPTRDDGVEEDHESQASEEDSSLRAVLFNNWASWSCWYKLQPVDYVQSYFGEKVAMYFAWLGYYTVALIPPAIVGFVVCIVGLVLAYGGSRSDNSGVQTCDLKGLTTRSPFCNATAVAGGQLACRDVLMCPLCDAGCDYWLLSSVCGSAKAEVIFDNGGTVFFAIFMALWATFFIEFWKRSQEEIAHSWSMSNFEEEEERPRPKFEAKVRPSLN